MLFCCWFLPTLWLISFSVFKSGAEVSERSPRTPLRTTTEIVFVSKTAPQPTRRSSFREAQDVPQTGFLEVCRNTPKNTNSWDCVEIHLGTRIQKHEPPGLCRNTPRNTNSSTSKKQLRSFCYCLRAFTISSPKFHCSKHANVRRTLNIYSL